MAEALHERRRDALGEGVGERAGGREDGAEAQRAPVLVRLARLGEHRKQRLEHRREARRRVQLADERAEGGGARLAELARGVLLPQSRYDGVGNPWQVRREQIRVEAGEVAVHAHGALPAGDRVLRGRVVQALEEAGKRVVIEPIGIARQLLPRLLPRVVLRQLVERRQDGLLAADGAESRHFSYSWENSSTVA